MRRMHRLAVAGLALVCWAGIAEAQVTETPVAFDSAGRVRNLTPPLAVRLGLNAPTWPVQGEFREARLFAISTGGHILAVERLTGAVERHSLSDESAAALRAVVDAAMARTGYLVTEAQTDLISEPARGKFVRNQMFLASTYYSGALATLVSTDDAQFASAVYLLSVGGSFFIVTNFARTRTITRAQNDLATDGAFRGSMFANGLLAVFGPEDVGVRTGAFVTLAGSLGGSIFGYNHARGLTDAEGKAAKSTSSYAMLSTLGLLGIVASDSINARVATAAVVGTGIGGYLFGPRYPRRARYSVTAGDINMLWIGSTLGVAAAFVPFVESDLSSRVGWTIFTTGLLGGAYLAERAWAQPFDHTQGEVAQIWLGTLGGALMGSAVLLLAEPESGSVALGVVTAGAFFGALGAHGMSDPQRAPTRRRAAIEPRDQKRRASFEWNPASLALTASGVRGNHGLLTVRF
jgi:hypothetical protein